MARFVEILIKILFLWPYIGLALSVIAFVYCLAVGSPIWWFGLIAGAFFGHIVYKAHFG